MFPLGLNTMSRLRRVFPITDGRRGGRLITPQNKKWWTLAAVSVGLFMIMLDATVVNVALPAPWPYSP